MVLTALLLTMPAGTAAWCPAAVGTCWKALEPFLPCDEQTAAGVGESTLIKPQADSGYLQQKQARFVFVTYICLQV
jgi:hypothetical protein